MMSCFSDSFAWRNFLSIVVIRPGALGDVLVLRGVLRFLRGAFPDAAITLLAPGERGRLFLQAGWVERLLDWDRAEYAGLFAWNDDDDGDNAIPDKRLCETFADCTLVVAFVDAVADDSVFQKNVRRFAPGAACFFAPSRPRPEDAVRMPIGEWFLGGVRSFCLENGLLPPERRLPDAGECLGARIPVFARGETGGGRDGNALVIHPGSGSRLKNWSVANYAALARMLLDAGTPGGESLFSRLVITAGEADGELGEQLRCLVPGAQLHPPTGLMELAGVIAGVRLYIGNDSGVSHLASLVCHEGDGRAPLSAVIFGPSNIHQWSPPGALILNAGQGMSNLPPERAFSRIMSLLS